MLIYQKKNIYIYTFMSRWFQWIRSNSRAQQWIYSNLEINQLSFIWWILSILIPIRISRICFTFTITFFIRNDAFYRYFHSVNFYSKFVHTYLFIRVYVCCESIHKYFSFPSKIIVYVICFACFKYYQYMNIMNIIV